MAVEQMAKVETTQLRELAVMISVAYLRANPLSADKVGRMIRETYDALSACGAPTPAPVSPPFKHGRPVRRNGKG